MAKGCGTVIIAPPNCAGAITAHAFAGDQYGLWRNWVLLVAHTLADRLLLRAFQSLFTPIANRARPQRCRATVPLIALQACAVSMRG